MYIWTIPTTKQKITFFRYEQQKGKNGTMTTTTAIS